LQGPAGWQSGCSAFLGVKIMKRRAIFAAMTLAALLQGCAAIQALPMPVAPLSGTPEEWAETAPGDTVWLLLLRGQWRF